MSTLSGESDLTVIGFPQDNMDDSKLYPCCEQKYSGVISGQHSSIAQPLILVVDDNEDNLLLMTYVLANIDCTLLTATDGLSALSLARTHQPDLILLDILMPHMDGTEVVTHLREDSKLKSTPVIAVTAYAKAEDRARLLQAGCSDYISKPYMLDDIETKVKRYLRLPVAIS